MPSNRVICVVQARMGSTRLPGKVLSELGGQPMLGVMLDRLADVNAEIVVATSDLPVDDAIEELVRRRKIAVVRGSHADVLARYTTALSRHPADHVIRLTADCPLIDAGVVNDVLALHLATGADYTSNTHPRTYPQGLDTEVIREESLQLAHRNASLHFEREHVTPFLYRHPERFNLVNQRLREDYSSHHWTVDTPEDLEFVRQLFHKARQRSDMVERDKPSLWYDIVVDSSPRHGPNNLWLSSIGRRERNHFLQLRSDPLNMQFSPTQHLPQSERSPAWYDANTNNPVVQMLGAVRNDQYIGFAIIEAKDVVGQVELIIDPLLSRSGVARQMLQLLIDRQATEYQYDVLSAYVHNDDQELQAAFNSVGFVSGFSRPPFVRWNWNNPSR